jgi:DNA-binding transcriptional regulator YiaG
MPRPRILPLNGIRRTITLSRALDDELVVKAAVRRTTVSVLIEELLLRALNSSSANIATSRPLDFPDAWDGTDLRERLIAIRMRQKDLADLLQVHKNTLNNWVNGSVPWATEMLQRVQRALLEWSPDTQASFRIGGRSQWS